MKFGIVSPILCEELQKRETQIEKLSAELEDARKEFLPVNLIDPNPWHPRTFFDPSEIEKLAASIAQNGLIQPISVRRVAMRYQLIVGERRLRAHKLLGLPEIKVTLTHASDEDMAILSLAENLVRKSYE